LSHGWDINIITGLLDDVLKLSIRDNACGCQNKVEVESAFQVSSHVTELT